jgi:membrane associated rhomboid family serine protease
MNAPIPNPPTPSTRQPVFNLPPVVAVLAAVLLAIHAVRVFLLSDAANVQLLLAFSFIPAREVIPGVMANVAPVDAGTRLWTFITYAFLHADWAHVVLNVLWLVAFGAPVARRFGALRFLGYAALGAVAGAALHLAFYSHDFAPLIGASAAISALMAGASRFLLSGGGPLWSGADFIYRLPAPPLREVLRNGRVLAFVGVWFLINLVFGLTNGGGLSSGAVAWDAHVGGFIAGLLAFGLFDPVRAGRA